MIDPALNQQVLGQIGTRISSLDAIIADPNTSPEAKAEANAAKAQLTEEQALRNRIANGTPAQKAKAERDLAALRQRTCPAADDGTSVATCRPSVVFVHIHMRFLLPKALLADLRDASKYPRRVANCPADTFRDKYSFEGKSVPSKTRWSGVHPVIGATVTMGGKTATTDRNGTARFEGIGAGAYTVDIVPPPNQDTTIPAGPDLPVRNGYVYASAPPAKYRPFSVSASIDGEGRWVADPEATVTLPHKGDDADYAGVAGVSNMDLYLDWKPDWLKAANRHLDNHTSNVVVLHQTSTALHEQIGSPIDWFNNSSGNTYRTAAHYLVDLDGHIVKLVHEAEVANHAGPSHWHQYAGNSNGIGIETVHTDTNVTAPDGKLREFPAEQYGGINRLVTRLRSAFGITKAYVCGHNDCKNDEKKTCPGDMFDWKSIEDAGNAPRPLPSTACPANRVVVTASQTVDDATVPMSQQLYKIGYTHKTVEEALKRFIVRAWSGSRFAARPTGASVEAVPPALVLPGQPRVRQPAGQQVTQVVADAINTMFRDI